MCVSFYFLFAFCVSFIVDAAVFYQFVAYTALDLDTDTRSVSKLFVAGTGAIGFELQ